MRVLLIHGAGASSISWRHVRSRSEHETHTFDYDVTQPFGKILLDCLDRIEEVEAEAVVGHSFGGVVAWHAADCTEQVVCGVSVASPWAGSVYAQIVEACTLGLLPTRFFSNVMRDSIHSRAPRERPVPVPWMNLVTTKGVVGIGENDGILTTSSQRSLYHDHQLLEIDMHYSHSEILLSDELPATIDSFVSRVGLGLKRT